MPGRTGVWVPADGHRPERKVAAIGLRVQGGVSLHGFALNCDPDLAEFDKIVPCGITDAGVTSLSVELGREVTVDELREPTAAAVADALDGRLPVAEHPVARAEAPAGLDLRLHPSLVERRVGRDSGAMTITIQRLMGQIETIRTPSTARSSSIAISTRRWPSPVRCTLRNLPAGTGGSGPDELRGFLGTQLLPHLPADLAFRRLSRTVDRHRVVERRGRVHPRPGAALAAAGCGATTGAPRCWRSRWCPSSTPRGWAP